MAVVFAVFIRVNPDPVRSHRCSDNSIAGLGDDCLGLLQRHMAVDTIRLCLCSESQRCLAILYFVAAQAFCGVRGGRPLGSVNLVACGAGHQVRRDEAAAFLEQPNLVGMHIRACILSDSYRMEIALQWRPRNVGERRRQCNLLRAAVA